MTTSSKSVDDGRHRTLSSASSDGSSSIGSNSTHTSRMSTTKRIDHCSKHLILGDFELTNIIDCEEYVLCCKYSPIDDVFAVGLGNGTIKVIIASPVSNLENRDKVQLSMFKFHNHLQILSIYSKAGVFQYVLSDNDTKTRRYPVTCVKFYANKSDLNNDDRKILVATYTAGYVKAWHYPTQQCILTFDEQERQPLALDFNCDYTHLYVAGSDCIINCYDFLTKTLIRKNQASESRDRMDGHKNRIHAICSHPTMEAVYLTGGWDETVHYWDERTLHSQKHFAGPHICGDALHIVAEHQVVLTGSWRKNSTLQIWDFATGELLKDAFGNNATSMLYCTKFCPKDYILCAGNDQNEAMIYDYSSLQMIGGIRNLDNAVYCADTDLSRTEYDRWFS